MKVQSCLFGCYYEVWHICLLHVFLQGHAEQHGFLTDKSNVASQPSNLQYTNVKHLCYNLAKLDATINYQLLPLLWITKCEVQRICFATKQIAKKSKGAVLIFQYVKEVAKCWFLVDKRASCLEIWRNSLELLQASTFLLSPLSTKLIF